MFFNGLVLFVLLALFAEFLNPELFFLLFVDSFFFGLIASFLIVFGGLVFPALLQAFFHYCVIYQFFWFTVILLRHE